MRNEELGIRNSEFGIIDAEKRSGLFERDARERALWGSAMAEDRLEVSSPSPERALSIGNLPERMPGILRTSAPKRGQFAPSYWTASSRR